MKYSIFNILISVVLIILWAACSFAKPPMIYIYNSPESLTDKRYEFHWKILNTALEKTKQKYGSFRMVPSVRMTEQRQVYELKSATGKLNVMYLDSTPDLEKSLVPIRIPVDKNLVGHRVFLIRKEDRSKFAEVRTVDDLRKFSYGFSADWIDVEIFRSNKFRVVDGSDYDGLFEMLVNRRFDVFSRGVNEIQDEYNQRKDKMPGLFVEEKVLLIYPAPMYFWFPNTREGRLLAGRAEEGMRMMIRDGTYDEIFDAYFRDKLHKLNLKNRRIFRINNPLLGPKTPFNDKQLWFDLQKI